MYYEEKFAYTMAMWALKMKSKREILGK